MSAGKAGTKYQRYIDAIQTGAIPSCKWVKLAVERQVNDLKRAESPDFPYYFDTAAADRIIKFASLARLTSGEWRLKQKRFDLEDWQGFILSCVFGWKHKETGYRRFTRVYEEIARKNGKTEKAGLVMNYCLYEGAGEDAAQVFSAATTKDQARIAFKAAQSMARGFSSDGYAWAKSTQALTHVVLLGESSMKALSSEDNFLDGLSPSCAVIDEYHAHDTAGVLNVLESGMGSRNEPLLYVITTAGHNINGPCYTMRENALQILEGIKHDETFFAIVYTLDEGDDWQDENVWVKANPNLGVSLKESFLRQQVHRAKQEGSATRVEVLTKNFNLWQNAAESWLPDEVYQRCAAGFDRVDFEGRECYVGMDFAATNDFNAASFFFPARHHMEPHFVYRKIWITEESAEYRGKEDPTFTDWAINEYIEITPGNAADYDKIAEDMIAFSEFFRFKILGFDRQFAAYIIPKLVDHGIECQAFQQSIDAMCAPSMDIERMMLRQEIQHDGNPCLRWMYSNVVLTYNSKGNYRPDKGKSKRKKIDGVISDVIAVGMWRDATANNKQSYLSSSDMLFV